MPPNIVRHSTVDQYRLHYKSKYSQSVIYTFDGIRVYFPQQQFDDAFFESANRKKKDKSVFSWQRAERIDWIGAALVDRFAELYAGWDRNKKRIDNRRRIALVYGDYVVVLQIYAKKKSATFITAYIADSNTVAMIRKSPRWV